MAWHFDNDRPIYQQLMEQIKLLILSGEYQPGQQLPPVREFATIAGVNPNTLQKAFSELERDGLLFTQRTAGRYITEDAQMIQSLRQELAQTESTHYLKQMQKLGFTTNDCIQQLQVITSKEDLI